MHEIVPLYFELYASGIIKFLCLLLEGLACSFADIWGIVHRYHGLFCLALLRVLGLLFGKYFLSEHGRCGYSDDIYWYGIGWFAESRVIVEGRIFVSWRKDMVRVFLVEVVDHLYFFVGETLIVAVDEGVYRPFRHVLRVHIDRHVSIVVRQLVVKFLYDF